MCYSNRQKRALFQLKNFRYSYFSLLLDSVIDSAIFPFQRTVLLLDVMLPPSNQWERALMRKNCSNPKEQSDSLAFLELKWKSCFKADRKKCLPVK